MKFYIIILDFWELIIFIITIFFVISLLTYKKLKLFNSFKIIIITSIVNTVPIIWILSFILSFMFYNFDLWDYAEAGAIIGGFMGISLFLKEKVTDKNFKNRMLFFILPTSMLFSLLINILFYFIFENIFLNILNYIK